MRKNEQEKNKTDNNSFSYEPHELKYGDKVDIF